MVGRRGYDALRARVEYKAEFWQKKYSNIGSLYGSGSEGGCSPDRWLGSGLWGIIRESLAIFILQFRNTSLHVLKHKLLGYRFPFERCLEVLCL